MLQLVIAILLFNKPFEPSRLSLVDSVYSRLNDCKIRLVIVAHPVVSLNYCVSHVLLRGAFTCWDFYIGKDKVALGDTTWHIQLTFAA